MNKEEIIKEAKKRFKPHYVFYVTVRDDANLLPVELSPFTSIIQHSIDELQHKNYVIRVHAEYITVSSKDFLFEPFKLLFDDKLWLELYYVFYIVDKKKVNSLKKEKI